ncbi:hypothetical protein AC1031_007908 [Aphanomyces cochlioides]|nr:hypothetical protein AC1031_007908 [Aphanomyces cochlioides]
MPKDVALSLSEVHFPAHDDPFRVQMALTDGDLPMRLWFENKQSKAQWECLVKDIQDRKPKDANYVLPAPVVVNALQVWQSLNAGNSTGALVGSAVGSGKQKWRHERLQFGAKELEEWTFEPCDEIALLVVVGSRVFLRLGADSHGEDRYLGSKAPGFGRRQPVRQLVLWSICHDNNENTGRVVSPLDSIAELQRANVCLGLERAVHDAGEERNVQDSSDWHSGMERWSMFEYFREWTARGVDASPRKFLLELSIAFSQCHGRVDDARDLLPWQWPSSP